MPNVFLTDEEAELLIELLDVHSTHQMMGKPLRSILKDFDAHPLMDRLLASKLNQRCLVCDKELTSADSRKKTCSDKCRQIHSRKQRTAKAKIDAAATARVKAAYAAGPEAVAALHAELGVS